MFFLLIKSKESGASDRTKSSISVRLHGSCVGWLHLYMVLLIAAGTGKKKEGTEWAAATWIGTKWAIPSELYCAICYCDDHSLCVGHNVWERSKGRLWRCFCQVKRSTWAIVKFSITISFDQSWTIIACIRDSISVTPIHDFIVTWQGITIEINFC